MIHTYDKHKETERETEQKRIENKKRRENEEIHVDDKLLILVES